MCIQTTVLALKSISFLLQLWHSFQYNSSPLNANIETKPKLKSKIASSCATGQCTDVTTVQLVKSLVLTTWKLIIITAVFALLRVVTS
jgi:hypothetical protein